MVIFRGKGLEGPLTDADPNREGYAIPAVKPRDPKNAKQKKMAKLIADFYKAALPVFEERKAGEWLPHARHRASAGIPLFEDRYKLKPACLAVYPMYRGLAQLVGMKKKIEGPQSIAEQFERYLTEYDNYDFSSSTTNYPTKPVKTATLPRRRKPSKTSMPRCRSCSRSARCHRHHGRSFHAVRVAWSLWHPQPVLLNSATSGSDKLDRFTETGANSGSLSVFPAKFLIRLMQANAKMFDKFGA